MKGGGKLVDGGSGRGEEWREVGCKDVFEVGEKCGVICKQVHLFHHEVSQARQRFLV